MPLVGFEPTIPVSERAKTSHALDRAAIVIGYMYIMRYIFIYKATHLLNNIRSGLNFWQQFFFVANGSQTDVKAQLET
jgi:hypothetical protein